MLDIAADEDDASGDYTIASTLLTPPEQPVGCLQPPNQLRFGQVGITVSGIINSGDCAGSGTARFDLYNVKMNQGGLRKITVTLSAGGAVEIRVKDGTTPVVTPMSRGNAGDVVVQFTPSAAEYYAVSILTTPGTGSVSYTIKIE